MSQQEQILVVDDNAAGRYLKTHLLSRADYTIREADTGKAALELIGKTQIALIVLDVKLPDINGIDLCRDIKRDHPDTLIIQTSAAFVSRQDRAVGLAGGADAYLIEPLEPDELKATVESLLRRYRMEQGLRDKHDTLEQQVVQHGEQIAAMDAKLRSEIDQRADAEELLRHAQKLDVLGQLTGGIAHDFNNVLTIIMGNLESLRRQLGKGDADPARLKTHADNAFYGAQRAMGITRQLLAFSRKQTLEPKALNCGEFIRALTHLLRQVLGEKVEIDSRVTPELWAVFADPGQLETAILNLAVNARDAMPSGGKLTIAATNTSFIPDGAQSASDFVLIAIGDSGSGMSPGTLKMAFEPFFTTKDVGHGTGLGLSQVHGFMRQTGGHVKIDSRVGEGTTVKLYLPRFNGMVPIERTAEIAMPETQARHSKASILVVEDDADVRDHSAGVLREMGYTVLEAASGQEALDILEARPHVDLLFTDVGLWGGFSGPQLAEEALKIQPRLKILYTTGYANERLIKEGLKPEDAVITKPFSFEALSQKVDSMLDAPVVRRAILVIEDEPMIRMDIVDSLQELGFDILEAGTIAEAAKHITGNINSIGAVLTDVGLPDGRGDDFIVLLRVDHPSLPVIITTGYSDNKLHAKFAGDAKTDFVTKPYYSEQIVDSLRAMGFST